MAKWLVTVEQMYTNTKRNMIIYTLENLPTVEEIQRVIEQANNRTERLYFSAHVITFMQRLKED